MDTAFMLPALKCGVIIPISGQTAQIGVKMTIYGRLYHFPCTLSISHGTKWSRDGLFTASITTPIPIVLDLRLFSY